ASGHRRDDDRSTQRLAEDRDRGVDVLEPHVGQRVVNQLNALEQRRGTPESDVVFCAERDVIRLALSNRRHRASSVVERSKEPMPERGIADLCAPVSSEKYE